MTNEPSGIVATPSWEQQGLIVDSDLNNGRHNSPTMCD